MEISIAEALDQLSDAFLAYWQLWTLLSWADNHAIIILNVLGR